MSWYDDSTSPPGAPLPGAPTQAGPPQQMPTNPPMPPPPGVHGDLPTNGSGNTNRRLLLILGLGIAAVVTLVGGIGAFLLLSGPEELSMNDYAEKMCDEAIEPGVKERDDLSNLGIMKAESKTGKSTTSRRLRKRSIWPDRVSTVSTSWFRRSRISTAVTWSKGATATSCRKN